MNSRFLPKEAINNYNLIIDAITDGVLLDRPNVLANEHLGDVMYLLDYYDKKRNPDDPELQKAVYTILHGVLESKKVKFIYNLTFIESARSNPPQTEEELYTYLDMYWHVEDNNWDIIRAYLVWFEKVIEK